MPTARMRERAQHKATLAGVRSGIYPFASYPAGLIRLTMLAVAAFCCSSQTWAQSSSQNDEPSTRTTESHSQSGDRTVDKQSVQRRDAEGNFSPYQDVEKETVKVDSNTVKTITRTYGRDANGDKTVVQVVEEETHTLPGGDSNVTRTTSNSDGNGGLQLIQRQIEETKKTGKDSEATKTTIMLPSANGGLTAAVRSEERREKDANGTVASQKTTLVPDGAGNWHVGEIRQTVTKQEDNTKDRTTDERISRPDSEGNISEVSHNVTKEAETAPGEKHETTETFSVDVPGAVRDGSSLHLVKRSTTNQSTSSTGQQTTQQRVEQSNPGDPTSSLQVTIISTDTVNPGDSGAQAVRTVQMRDANGSYGSVGVVSVDTTKSNNVNAVQVQIAPSEKPKAAAPKNP
jgi:hypothetical protein